MKRRTEALVMIELVAAIAAMAVVGLSGAARAQPDQEPAAATPVVKLTGSAALTKRSTARRGVATPARFDVHVGFSTDPPGASLLTIRRAVVFFPDHAGTNGRRFPSCSARQIERFRGNVGRCPKGSRIGSGTLRARALQLGVTAHGRVAMFNSHRGKRITFNFQATHPALINESLDAPLTQLHGRYGEKLTLVVPRSLQEILSGVFVGIEDFDVTIGGAVRRRGASYSFLKARTCPKRALHAVFDFVDGTTGRTASTTADARVRCKAR